MNIIKLSKNEITNINKLYQSKYRKETNTFIDPVKQITKEERGRLAYLIKNLKIQIADLMPIDIAIITCGGVDVKQINPKTMESKLVKNLYFAGEIIDVDSYTGGFNLQIAYATGYTAGM